MTTDAAATDARSGPRRFVPPPRHAVGAHCFAHPMYADIAGFADLLVGSRWPTVAELDARLAVPGLQLVLQDDLLLADGLHYEVRIAQGRLATRACNWHDLFNALAWARHPQLKRALNAQQCLHIAAQPPGQRSRAQAALTQFDESGVVVRVQEPAVLAAWDRHDWRALFDPQPWRSGRVSVVAVFGHALMEQGLLPGRLLVGKAVVVVGEDDETSLDAVACAVREGRALTDPLQLRPLPLAGIPGWHGVQDAAFHDNVDYFRPLREGRTYPAPLRA